MTPRHLLRRTLALLAITPLMGMVMASGASPGAALDPPTVNEPGAVDEANEIDLFASPCPEMTDSVFRLYSAFFGREPDAAGWEYWMSVYVAPTTNLESIANDFVLSEEFVSTYGSLTNGEFVRLVYRNVMGREPDQVGYDHWVGSLDRGYSRGAVMIAFSESAEYVAQTDTWPPLAGFLQWYSRPLQFACGNGSVVVGPEQQAPFADLLIWNDAAEAIGYRVGVDTPTGPFMDEYGQLGASSYSIYWNMNIGQIDGSSLIIEVPDRPDVFWTAVFYDAPHAADRAPYTDGFGVVARADDAAAEFGRELTFGGGGATATGFADWER